MKKKRLVPWVHYTIYTKASLGTLLSYNKRWVTIKGWRRRSSQSVAALFFKKQEEYIGTKPEIKLGNLYDFLKPTGVMYMSFGIFNCNLERSCVAMSVFLRKQTAVLDARIWDTYCSDGSSGKLLATGDWENMIQAGSFWFSWLIIPNGGCDELEIKDSYQ